MATRQYCCFKGRGEISLVDYAAHIARTAGFLPVGNAPTLAINVTENTETVPDFVSPGGGTACTVRELSAVNISLSLRCHSPRNWAIATGALLSDVETAAVASEQHVLHIGAVVPLEHLIDDSVAVVVSPVGAGEPYVLGTDYEITPAGSIRHLEGGAIPAPTVTNGVGQANISVAYTRRDQTLIQLYTAPTRAMVLHFDGYNVAEQPLQATHFDLFKVTFGPAATVNVINENLSVLELTGSAERDKTRPLGTLANPFSQYGTLKI